MKSVSSNIKIQMAQYNELSSFSQFGSDIDLSTKQLLDNGAKIIEILKQKQYHSFKNAEHVVVLYAVMHGYIKNISVNNIKQFEKDLLEAVNRETDIISNIEKENILTDEIKLNLNNFLEQFVKNWLIINNGKYTEH